MGRSRSRSHSRGRQYSRSRSRSRDGSPETYRVHVADLCTDPDKREIERKFERYGPVLEVWVAKNPPCFAFVVFKYKDDAETAIREMDGQVISGCRIRCSFARPRKRGGRAGFDNNRCYRCGEEGHFSRECYGFLGRRNTFASRRGEPDSLEGSHDSKTSANKRSRSRSRGRRSRSRSPVRRRRERSRSASKERRRKRDSNSRSRSRSQSRSNRKSSKSSQRKSSEDNSRRAAQETRDRGTPPSD